jgi:D-3-phosphoglycerate dehydrogenase / 2-oxoglutarate reductase
MADWKVLLTDGLEDNGQAILRASVNLINNNGISPSELVESIGEYDALIIRGRTIVNEAIFEAGKKLKVVGRSGVGVDNIDLEAARQHHVIVVNSPKATTVSVAELTMGLMLSIMREIPLADSSMKRGGWIKKELEGSELFEKTLGIIGYGRIGAAVGIRAQAFGMTVLGYDPCINENAIQDQGSEPVSLEELFIRSDIISLHIPLNDDTRSMINRSTLSKMKHGVRIICTARGGLIDEDALTSALESGQVTAVGLDVFATEPPGLTGLVGNPHVVVTPHIGAQTLEAQQRAANDIALEILAALEGQPLHWRVA